MKLVKRTASRTKIEFTPEEATELGLKVNAQEWSNHYHTALGALMDSGVPFENAVKFLMRGSNKRSFRLALWIERRFRKGREDITQPSE